ncbi:MAG: SNF2-related protein [Bradymonadaceae bacterium]
MSESPLPAILAEMTIDLHSLRQWASESTITRGIQYFKDNRVVELDFDETEVRAGVEDEDAVDTVFVDVTLDGAGRWLVSCGCGADEPLCAHAVAALFAWADAQPEEIAMNSAADRAVAARVQRARREVEVEVALHQGDGIFGTWKAHSVTSDRPSSRTYRVLIRSLTERANHCECLDFQTNTLGTCKHIEAVLHRIRKDHELPEDPASMPRPDLAFVHLAWDVPDAPRIRVQRPPRLEADVEAELDELFDGQDLLKEPVIETFHRLGRRMRDMPRVHLGRDAQDHVERLAEVASQTHRSARIRAEILACGGRLPGVQARLYPYQVEGVAFLASTGRAVLADDMGLGKTLQAIAAASWLMRNEGVRRTLVICPASLKHQWAREIERFTGFDTEVVGGNPASRLTQYRRQASFTIANYELVLRDWDEINRELGADLVILDEAQRIKNWRTKTADAIKAVRSRYAFVLTGTPLENRLEDLYSLMQAVNPRILGPLWRFMIDFHVLDEKDKVLGYRNLSELRRRLGPVMLRRDRREVREQLPDRIQTRLDVELSPRQRRLHDEALTNASYLAQITKRRPLTPTEQNRLMAALQQARMACNAAGLVDEKTVGAPKLDELDDLLEELCVQSGRKVVVFSQWKRMTTIVEDRARKLGLGVIHLHGGVPTARRGALMESFESDPAMQVFVSTDAGGTGLNLQAASALINLDVPWNPAVLEQRIARVHRLGQAEPVQIILMISVNSYEERVAQLAGNKQHLFDHVVSPDAELDVVGLSKKGLEWITESLAAPVASEQAGAVSEDVVSDGEGEGEGEGTVSEAVMPALTPTEPVIPDRTNEIVEVVQRRLGQRVERILAVATGFIVVVDEVDALAEAVAESASDETLIVAVLDRKTAARLQMLGMASPLASATLVAVGNEATTHGGESESHVNRRLRAAEVLVREGMPRDGLELAADVLLQTVARHAGSEAPRDPADACVWLYATALPLITAADFDVVATTKVFSMAQATAIPGALAHELLRDARRICEGLTANRV